MPRVALSLILLTMVSLAMAKSGRTYYTPARLAQARENLKRHEWARNELKRIMEDPVSTAAIGGDYVAAARMVEKSDDDLFAMMPSIKIPRRWESFGWSTCPQHGAEIRKFGGFYPWIVDIEKHPYKVQCPVGHEFYPSNDFAAGDLTSGPYPDDGHGYVQDGKRYLFIKYFVNLQYLGYVVPTIRSLSLAYALTGERRYGHKAAVLLSALAAQWPGPKYHSEYCYEKPYGPLSGAVVDHIWEPIKLVPLALSYDALYPIFDEDPELLTYLRAKGLPAADSGEARGFIEEHLFRQAMQGIIDQALLGNVGLHQEAAATMALVMDDLSDTHPNSRDSLHDAYYEGFGPAAYVMSNFLTRDGGGYEGPSYDRIKFNFVRVAQLTEELRALHPDVFTEAHFPRIMAEPKARALFDFFIDVTSLGYYWPPVGDTGGGLKPRAKPPQYHTYPAEHYLDGYRLYRDPRYATAALGMKGQAPAEDLFEPPLAEEMRRAAASAEGKITKSTRLLDGYGLAFLHGGEGQREREAVINYTALTGHHQQDYLALFLFANELDYLPDLGYPFTWDNRRVWDASIYAHNTVAVDGCQPLWPNQVPRGWVSLLGDRDGVKVAAVAHRPYMHHAQLEPNQPPVTRYERICVMVEEDGQDAYLVDLFVIEGGKRHDQSWHSAQVEPVLPDLDWAEQPTGTAAGADVPFNGAYVNVRGQETRDALCCITGVKRATLTQPKIFTWDFGLEEPAGLRLHTVPVDGGRQVIFGGGRSPAHPQDWRLPYVFLRNESQQEGLKTRFLTILEPYRGEARSRIQSIEVTGTWPLLIRVRRGDVQDEIKINAPSPAGVMEPGLPRQVGLSLRTLKQGQVQRAVQFGEMPGAATHCLRGRIIALKRGTNSITINLKLPAGQASPQWVRLHSPGRSSMYRILGAMPGANGSTVLRLRESALLGRGVPLGYRAGRIDNAVPLPFATGRADGQDSLADFPCAFTGARVENAGSTVSHRLRGVSSPGSLIEKGPYDLYLEKLVAPLTLEREFGSVENGQPFSIYDYGVGDEVEIVLSRSGV